MTIDRQLWLANYPKGIQWDGPIRTHPLHELLENTAVKYGTQNAVNFLGARTSWHQVNRISRQLAKGLQENGFGKGSHIGILMPNCPYFIYAYYAILRIGATVVHFNPLYTTSELSKLVKDSDTDAIISVDLSLTADKALDILNSEDTPLKKVVICPFADSLPPLKKWLFKIFKFNETSKIPYNTSNILAYTSLINNDGHYKLADIDVDEDIALLQFTGGTTGVPKAAMLTHANLSANTEQCRMWFSNAKEGQEKIAAVLPFFHVFAMTAVLNLGTRLGMEMFLLPRFELRQTLKMINNHKITFFPAVPAIYNAINHFPDLEQYDLSSVNTCVSGGAPLPEEVKKEFEKITGCVLVEGYGLTETSPVACVNPVTGKNQSGSIGLPLPQTEIGLYCLDDRQCPVDLGERGELCIKGPQVMKGYYKKEDETKNCFTDDGFLRTGDVAIMDKAGYFYIVDRIKDLIITNGYNVYPRNVEEAIYLHPAVEECIVAGIEDEKRGEAVKAWVKLKEGKTISAPDLKSFLQDKLSPLEMPRHIEFRKDPLPKTMIGKLSRKDILQEERDKKAKA